MDREIKKKERKRFWWLTLGVLVLLPMVLTLSYVAYAAYRIETRMEQLATNRSSSFFASYPAFRRGQQFTEVQLTAWLTDQGYVLKNSAASLLPGEYAKEKTAEQWRITLVRPAFEQAGLNLPQTQAVLVLEPKDGVLHMQGIFHENAEAMESFENLPKKVASYFAGRFRTQDSVRLSEIPVSLRYAVMAIEDVRFLEHHGVSIRGTFRALWKDLMAGGFVEGGSTLTQQLMKNLFFSREKALSRKIKEALYAIIADARYDKEALLEAYLNEVYMGQWGTHEIHGVAEGARYYFHRPVTQLSTSQSATLAAIIQAPNAQDPRRHPDRTIKRRNLVLKKMLDAEFILPDEYDAALKEDLGVPSGEFSLPDVDYFTDVVLQTLPANLRERLDTESLSIHVTLNPLLQITASEVLRNQIKNLTQSFKKLKKNEETGTHLQGALISIDVKQCSILAIQGGHSYSQTQFNRVTQGKRQAGSLFKPFVFWSAFQNLPEFSAQTLLEDSPFEWKYEGGQTWTPKNYDPEFKGQVPARIALENSINIPTARLAQKVGVPSIYQTLIQAGFPATLPKVPSLALGSADVSPFEVAQAYVTLARQGQSCDLRSIDAVFDSNGNEIYRTHLQEGTPIAPSAAFRTISLMQGTLTHGTARSAMASGIDVKRYAGKTGTTNESRDTWFVGFSPELLTVVWVGYDEKEKVGLTGSVAALPAWIQFTKQADIFTRGELFTPPADLTAKQVDHDDIQNSGRCKSPITEYFTSDQRPIATCD